MISLLYSITAHLSSLFCKKFFVNFLTISALFTKKIVCVN
nr:MAG TPA: hypothetical protein [Caudoviricetes sp.]